MQIVRRATWLSIVAVLFAGSGGAIGAQGTTSVPFAVTGTTNVGAQDAGAEVELRSVDACSPDCAIIARATLAANGSFFLWGPLSDITPPTQRLRVVARLPSGVYASEPFSLDADHSRDVRLTPWSPGATRVLLSSGVKSVASIKGFRTEDVAVGLAPAPYVTSALYYIHRTLYFFTDRALAGTGADTRFANDPSADGAVFTGSLVAHVARCASARDCQLQEVCTLPNEWTCDATPVSKPPDERAVYADPLILNASTNPLGALRDELEAETGSQGGPHTILVFVHGFNVDFATAVNYGARLSLEAEHLAHAVVIYSWPSRHDGQAYATDQERAGAAVTHFVAFLDMLAALRTHPAIILVGHSMGAHVVTEGVAAWAHERGDAPSATFERIVLFAGDEGQSDWNSQSVPGHTRAALVLASATETTIVQSANDAALIASWCVMHNDFRLGQPAAQISPAPNLDVEPRTGEAGYNGPGHTYFIEMTPIARRVAGWVGTTPLAEADYKTIPWLTSTSSGLPLAQLGAKNILCPLATKIFSH
jgi:pimeloyl-ACP methyl ester carboxylesterase